MSHPFVHYQESAEHLRRYLGYFTPRVCLILGSGLGDIAQEVQSPICIPYEQIPHFPLSTAQGHLGQMVFGTLAGTPVAVMQGRVHHYEGYSDEDIGYGVRVLRLLGCTALLVTNAAGCVHPTWQAGDIMLIRDQIKLAGFSPLRGENCSEFGVRFPDVSHLYTPRLIDIARNVADNLGTPLREGVYYYSLGPQYETPAEVQAIRLLGGDAVGMSTAPEVLVAAHCGMEVLGFSLLSNLAAGMHPRPLSQEEVLTMGRVSRHQFVPLVLGCLSEM